MSTEAQPTTTPTTSPGAPVQVADAPTDVKEEASIELSAGEGVSFDQFEAMEAAAERKRSLDAAAEVKKEEAKEAIKDDEKTESKETQEKESESAKKTETTETKTEAQTTEATSQKLLEGKLGEEAVKVSEDAEFPVKIDGEQQTATMRQLVDSFSGHKAVEHRFDQLKHEKKEFHQERDLINDTINEIFELSQTDSEAAIAKMVEAVGGDAHKVLDDFKAKVVEEANKLADMTPEEREKYLLASERDSYKKRLESAETQRVAQAERKQLEDHTAKLQEAHGVDDKTFNDVADELLALKQQGRLEGQVTPELIVQVAVSDRQKTQAKTILSAVMPEKASDEGVVQAVTKVMQDNPDFTEDEVRDVIVEAFGVKVSTASQTLSEKVRDSANAGTGVKKPIQPQNEEIFNFDDLG